MTDSIPSLAALREKLDRLAELMVYSPSAELLREAAAALASLEAEKHTWEAKARYLVDLPLCRLQLPDGSVPENTEQALQAWHDEARRAAKERDADRKSALANWNKLQAAEAERDRYKAALSELLDGARQYYAEADATANWETQMGEWLDRAERALAKEPE